MELSFLINAVKRRWWLILLFGLLGGLVAKSLSTTDTGSMFYSRAVLNVSPPSQSRVAVSFSSDPDRYVIGQLSVLNSAELAEQVATNLGDGETTGSVQSAVKIEHQAGTDIVLVTAGSHDPERARQIADEYVNIYIADLRRLVDDAQEPDIKQLNADLATTQDKITFIDQQITNAMAPFLNAAPTAVGFAPIPTPEQVVPDLVTQKNTLLQQYTRLSDTLKELELDAKLRVTSYVVQNATLPTVPEASSSSKYLVVAGGLAGAVVGLVVAVIWARLSRKVLDAEHVEELLGRPVVGRFPRLFRSDRTKRNVLQALPSRVVPFVDQLCVRAEANAAPDQPLTVAVVGTERGAAATTVALAMAGRYGANGSSVVLVDADVRGPEISKLFHADGGIPALLANAVAQAAGKGHRTKLDPFTPTPVGEVKVLGLGDKADGTPLRRQNVADMLAAVAADPTVHVIVIDAGPVLDAASTVQICQLVDAVVLAVPHSNQTVDLLQTVAHQLDGRRGELLPVITPRRKQLLRHRSAGDANEPVRVTGDPIIEQLNADEARSGRRNGTPAGATAASVDVESGPVDEYDSDDRNRPGRRSWEQTWTDEEDDQFVEGVDEMDDDLADEVSDDQRRRSIVESPARSARSSNRSSRKRGVRPREIPPIEDADSVADIEVSTTSEPRTYGSRSARPSHN